MAWTEFIAASFLWRDTFPVANPHLFPSNIFPHGQTCFFSFSKILETNESETHLQLSCNLCVCVSVSLFHYCGTVVNKRHHYINGVPLFQYSVKTCPALDKYYLTSKQIRVGDRKSIQP
ncbi:Hypothetical predicted protein [Octopus vulgaris]|uniref:Uncharacterized protein n=1 Tax=Octopus vulgaris TaxID=6645 RepID=A0AA36AQA2_OCTVU|nr:Hypothetical predicted protein [Octopus vulgaris]